MTMSKLDDSRGDSHLNNSMSQGPIINKTPQKANPPSNKPLTSFGIEDILGVASPTKPTSKDVVTKKHLENPHDDPHHLPNKINRSTSPDLPEITPISKPYPKHLYNTNNDEIDDNALSNGKRRMNNTLHIFNSLAKAPRNGKIAADDFRTATVAAAAAVASINQNNFFSSPFGCFPKTLLQGFIPAFNLNPNHLTPQHPQHPHHPHPQHPHHIIPHTDSQHHHQQQQHQHHHNPHHHHHHQQQQQQQQQQLHRQQQHSPSFLQGPVNLTLGNHNISGNHGNNSNGSNVKIVRPWDDNSGSCLDASSPSPSSSKTPPTTHTATTTTITTTTMASDDSYDEDDDEEISVDDEDPPCPPPGKRVKAANGDSVSPLDALMAMTSKTFAGLDNKGSGDPKRKDQAVMFGKHQPPKKRRKSRTAFTNQQIYELEKRFLYQKYLTPADRDEIAINLGLTNAQVITWFQNRRAKLKRDLEELKSDVTASKKLPIPRNMSGSVTEIELRRIQERTLRESFCNGGLQSPSSCSMASLSDDHDSTTPIHAATTPIRDVTTPIRSPPITDSERIHVDVVGSDPSDVELSKNSERRIEVNPSLRNASEDCVDNINNDMNENSNASLSPRESRENGGIVSSECGSRCDVDNQKNIGCFPMEVSPGVV